MLYSTYSKLRVHPTTRKRGVMLANRFSVQNHVNLRGLFGLLGAPFSEHDPASNAKTASRLWMSEHRQTITKYPDDLLLRVLFWGDKMNMLAENYPTDGTAIWRMNNPGGTFRAMMKRFRLYQKLERSGQNPGVFLCWAGQRLRDLKLGETIPEILKFVEQENPAALHYPWFKNQMLLDDNATDRYQRPLATETEIMLLCALVVYRDTIWQIRAVPISEPQRIKGVPARTTLYYELTRSDGPPIVILNGAAVERYDGKGNPIEPRPTAGSTAKEVAKIWGFGGPEGLMVSQPHSWRLALDIDRAVRGARFDPLFMTYCLPGPEAKDTPARLRLAKTVLGEVARILTTEQEISAEN